MCRPVKPDRHSLLQCLLGSARRMITATPGEDPAAAMFSVCIGLGSCGSVRVIWPRIRTVVRLTLALSPKAMERPSELLDVVVDPTQSTPLMLPTVLLSGVVMALVTACGPVLGQTVAIRTAGGVILGHLSTGRPGTVTSLAMKTMTDSIDVRTGWLTKTCEKLVRVTVV